MNLRGVVVKIELNSRKLVRQYLEISYRYTGTQNTGIPVRNFFEPVFANIRFQKGVSSFLFRTGLQYGTLL